MSEDAEAISRAHRSAREFADLLAALENGEVAAADACERLKAIARETGWALTHYEPPYEPPARRPRASRGKVAR